MKVLANVFYSVVVAGIIFIAWWWCFDRAEVADIALSNGCSCELKVFKYYTGCGIVSYSENGVCIGRTILSNGFLYDPLAIFPCPDHRSVVCVSWPDTYEAAFTIDFSKRPAGGAGIPDRLHGIVVDSSDFEVRACTTTEVSFVKKFIRTSDLKTFASCTRWGNSGANEDSRLGMLRFLMMATSPPDWRDPLLNFKEASPLLMAQYSSAEESKQ